MSSAVDKSTAYGRLKRRSQRFVDNYMLGMTGADAMKKAGFKGERPEIAASKLKALPDVRAAIEERRAVLCEAVGLRQEWIVAGMIEIALNAPERSVQLSAFRELAEIAGVKKVAAVQASLGPGLQVIIQQNVHSGNADSAQGPALGIVVNLPRPG